MALLWADIVMTTSMGGAAVCGDFYDIEAAPTPACASRCGWAGGRLPRRRCLRVRPGAGRPAVDCAGAVREAMPGAGRRGGSVVACKLGRQRRRCGRGRGPRHGSRTSSCTSLRPDRSVGRTGLHRAARKLRLPCMCIIDPYEYSKYT